MANIQNSIMINKLHEYVERLRFQTENFPAGSEQDELMAMMTDILKKKGELEALNGRAHFSNSDHAVGVRNVLKRAWKYVKEAKDVARQILQTSGADEADVKSLVTKVMNNYETLARSYTYEMESSHAATFGTNQALIEVESLKKILFKLRSSNGKGDIEELRRLTREALSLGPDEDAATEVELRRNIAALDQKDPITQDLKSILGLAKEFIQVKVHPETRELLLQLNTPGFGNPFFTFVADSPKYTMTAKANSAYRYQDPVVVAQLIYDLLDIPTGPRDVVFQSENPSVHRILDSINKNFQKLHHEIEELKPKSIAKTLGVNENARRILAAAPPQIVSMYFEDKLAAFVAKYVNPLIKARIDLKKKDSKLTSHSIDALVNKLERAMRLLRRDSTDPEIRAYEVAIKPAETYSKTGFLSRKWKHGSSGGRRTLKKNVR